MRKMVTLGVCLSLIGGLPVINSCKKEEPKVFGCTDRSATNYNPAATDDNGTCSYEGNVTFWSWSPGKKQTVSIGGQTGYITTYYSTTVPSCGSSGCANFTLPVGTYYYNATATDNGPWNGSVKVMKNGCTLELLE
jgi:hypothetical protein